MYGNKYLMLVILHISYDKPQHLMYGNFGLNMPFR